MYSIYVAPEVSLVYVSKRYLNFQATSTFYTTLLNLMTRVSLRFTFYICIFNFVEYFSIHYFFKKTNSDKPFRKLYFIVPLFGPKTSTGAWTQLKSPIVHFMPPVNTLLAGTDMFQVCFTFFRIRCSSLPISFNCT